MLAFNTALNMASNKALNMAFNKALNMAFNTALNMAFDTAFTWLQVGGAGCFLCLQATCSGKAAQKQVLLLMYVTADLNGAAGFESGAADVLRDFNNGGGWPVCRTRKLRSFCVPQSTRRLPKTWQQAARTGVLLWSWGQSCCGLLPHAGLEAAAPVQAPAPQAWTLWLTSSSPLAAPVGPKEPSFTTGAWQSWFTSTMSCTALVGASVVADFLPSGGPQGCHGSGQARLCLTC